MPNDLHKLTAKLEANKISIMNEFSKHNKPPKTTEFFAGQLDA
jgi:hypothetical protein